MDEETILCEKWQQNKCLLAANQLGFMYADLQYQLDKGIALFESALDAKTTCEDCVANETNRRLTIKTNLGCKLAEKGDKGNLERASQLWNEAAAQGHATAHYWLGCMYLKSNDVRAMGHLAVAAVKGHRGAKDYFVEEGIPWTFVDRVAALELRRS